MLTKADILTVPEAARYLRCSPATVQRSLHKGQLPGVKVGRQWRLSRPALNAYLRGTWEGHSRVFLLPPKMPD